MPDSHEVACCMSVKVAIFLFESCFFKGGGIFVGCNLYIIKSVQI